MEELIKAVSKLIEDKALALQLGKNGRQFVNLNFNREIIAEKFYMQLLQL